MRILSRLIGSVGVIALCVFGARTGLTGDQARQPEPGKSIGTITTRGDLIVFELNEGALGKANFFDMNKQTLRFVPEAAGGYRVDHAPFKWDAHFGAEVTGRSGATTTLQQVALPFGGKTWNAISIGATGAIGFGGDVTVDRFAQLQRAGRTLSATVPAIAVFFKPRLSGPRFVKELSDRVVVTWTLSDPVGGIQDFTWTKTVNRFQAVLAKDGSIEMSYDELSARDAIVGIYPSSGRDIAPEKIAEVDLSATTKKDGPFTNVFESFHYLALPNNRDLSCTIIKALGDKFDFLAYYADFRVDNAEAGTPSNGPLGGGSSGGAVTGIGATQRGLASYCTEGRFQWAFVQPVYAGSNQMQEYPPDGFTDANNHNIGFYTHQLAERTTTGKMPPYDYALSQIGHEMGHRWSAFVSATVGSETIPLGPTHWARWLHAPVAFPFQRPVEASAMGGGVWQDNFDGTFTQLDDDYYVPATGWSYLDLYLMGLIGPSEVPDFFILKQPAQQGRDANGHPIFKADRVKVTIQDVIAKEGPRLPDVDHAQKHFNTGMVMMVEHGKTPSRELIERTSGIGAAWIDYWATTTGHRASMTVSVK